MLIIGNVQSIENTQKMKIESGCLGWNLSFILISSIHLGKLLNLSERHFLHLLNGDISLPHRVNRLTTEPSNSSASSCSCHYHHYQLFGVWPSNLFVCVCVIYTGSGRSNACLCVVGKVITWV